MWRTQDTATPSTSGVLNQSAHLLGFESVAFLALGVLILFIYLFIIILLSFLDLLFIYFFYRVAVCHPRTERHADGMFNKAYRKALGQLSARKYLHSLMAKRVG